MEKDEVFIKQVGEVELYQKKSLTKTQLDVKRDLAKYLKKEQINQALEAMPPGRDKVICLTLWMTGIRVTELINIKKKDLDINASRATIRWQKNTKWHNRNIPLHQNLKSILELYMAGMNEEDLLFPVTRQRVFQITKDWFGISPHQFRHSFAVNFLEQTQDLVTLHRLLGHGNIKATMEYLKIVPVDQAKVLEKVRWN